MSNVLVTGATGFVGRALVSRLLSKNEQVIALARDIDRAKATLPVGTKIIQGDILRPNCGIETGIPKVDKLFHLAGIHTLRWKDKGKLIYNNNVLGTRRVLEFCGRNNISKLIFTSTAYTWDINPYGRSKIQNEEDIANQIGLEAVILKPSVIMGEEYVPYKGHFGQFVLMLAKLHRRPEKVRKTIERVLRLPLLEAVFRIPGDPSAMLNLVRIGDVVEALVSFDKPGTYWIVNHSPPTLRDIGMWIGEMIGVNIRFIPDKFTSSILETIVQRKGAAFMPYLWGDSFTNLASIKATPITKSFIQNTVRSLLEE